MSHDGQRRLKRMQLYRSLTSESICLKVVRRCCCSACARWLSSRSLLGSWPVGRHIRVSIRSPCHESEAEVRAIQLTLKVSVAKAVEGWEVFHQQHTQFLHEQHPLWRLELVLLLLASWLAGGQSLYKQEIVANLCLFSNFWLMKNSELANVIFSTGSMLYTIKKHKTFSKMYYSVWKGKN